MISFPVLSPIQQTSSCQVQIPGNFDSYYAGKMPKIRSNFCDDKFSESEVRQLKKYIIYIWNWQNTLKCFSNTLKLDYLECDFHDEFVYILTR